MIDKEAIERLDADDALDSFQKPGAPAASAARADETASSDQRMSATISGMPQAWIRRSATSVISSGIAVRSASVRTISKDRR